MPESGARPRACGKHPDGGMCFLFACGDGRQRERPSLGGGKPRVVHLIRYGAWLPPWIFALQRRSPSLRARRSKPWQNSSPSTPVHVCARRAVSRCLSSVSGGCRRGGLIAAPASRWRPRALTWPPRWRLTLANGRPCTCAPLLGSVVGAWLCV